MKQWHQTVDVTGREYSEIIINQEYTLCGCYPGWVTCKGIK